jgi:anti-anti-sigma regulatory factor
MTEKSYDISVTDGVTVVKLGPTLASVYESSLAELEALPELAESIDPASMLIDLSTIEYCGSAFVGFLFKIAGLITKRDGVFAVCGANNFTKMVLTTTKSEKMFSSFDSLDDGLATLGQNG